jgi:hypothetical protein
MARYGAVWRPSPRRPLWQPTAAAQPQLQDRPGARRSAGANATHTVREARGSRRRENPHAMQHRSCGADCLGSRGAGRLGGESPAIARSHGRRATTTTRSRPRTPSPVQRRARSRSQRRTVSWCSAAARRAAARCWLGRSAAFDAGGVGCGCGERRPCRAGDCWAVGVKLPPSGPVIAAANDTPRDTRRSDATQPARAGGRLGAPSPSRRRSCRRRTPDRSRSGCVPPSR